MMTDEESKFLIIVHAVASGCYSKRTGAFSPEQNARFIVREAKALLVEFNKEAQS